MAGLCTHVSSFLYVFVCVLVSIFVDMFRVYILYILKYDCTCVLICIHGDKKRNDNQNEK